MTFALDHLSAQDTSELRRSVLRPSWPVGSPMPGDDVAGALHVVALDEGRPVSTCILIFAGYPKRPGDLEAWQLRGMATAEGYRGQGLGASVLMQAIEDVVERGATLLWCRARLVAVPFYERYGFVVDSDQYVEPQTGLPHHDMVYELP